VKGADMESPGLTNLRKELRADRMKKKRQHIKEGGSQFPIHPS